MKRTIMMLLVLLWAGCFSRDEAAQLVGEPMPASAPPMADELQGGFDKAKEERARFGEAKGAKKDAPQRQRNELAGAAAPMESEASEPDIEDAEGGEAPAKQERSWFPETFLFEPLVKTDAEGKAGVEVTVPDRLTTWRILALAHDRQGSQAGTVARFLGTLPLYVDPVVPAFLIVGDEVELPIQVVNTTSELVEQKLSVSAEGVVMRSAAETVVRARQESSIVQMVKLFAQRPGEAVLSVRLGSEDAVLRRFPIRPNGRPRVDERSGTLAAPRELDLSGPRSADPDSALVRLEVFPGALAILRNELASAASRGGVAQDAYALLLAGRGAELLERLGEKPDQEALRKLAIIASQRVFAQARAPDVATAALLAEAALASTGWPVLERLGMRLLGTLASEQRPDGTFGGGSGWTLQRVLAMTAEAVRAVRVPTEDEAAKRRAAGASLRANSAFERHLARVEDGYTAAAIIASGVVEESLRARLAEKVRRSVRTEEDGTRVLEVPRGVLRSDGTPPSEAEATALAVLALEGDELAKTWWPDLGAALLSRYRPGTGWGDGRTNLACLQAVMKLFKDPIPERVSVRLLVDGKLLTSGELSGSRVREVVRLEAKLARPGELHRFRVEAEPPLPGLGFRLALHTWEPWEATPPDAGLDLRIEAPSELRAGEAATVLLTASAPAGMALEIEHSLPAGFQVDEKSLEALVADQIISSYDTEDGRVSLAVPVRAPGQPFQARYRVVPTLRGILRSSASSIAPAYRPDRAFVVPPTIWKVR